MIKVSKVPRTTREVGRGTWLDQSQSMNNDLLDLFLIKLQQGILPTFFASLSSFTVLGSALIDKGLLISNANYYLDQRV